MSKIFTAALLAALLSKVAGHTAVEEFEIGGKTYPGFRAGSMEDPGNDSPAWWTNQGWGYAPVYGNKINDPDIIAHVDAEPSPYTAPAEAGSQVTFKWHHTGSCEAQNEEGWDCSHHGWTATYLAPCNGDCKDVDKTQLEFFKIEQSSLIDYREGRYSDAAPKEQTGYWATDAIFYDNDNSHTVTIPSDIPNGNYVLRTEVGSLHDTGAEIVDLSVIQIWPQAFNIKVSGGDDNAQMPAGKKGTELYSANDAVLNWNLYWHEAKKTFSAAPGPKLATVASANARRSHPRDFSP